MILKELITKEEMLKCYDILLEVYPSLSIEDYNRELDLMMPHNYGQVVAIDNDEIVGLSGYWIGSKLWCGKYIELDNVVISNAYRGRGVGDQIFSYMEKKAKELGCSMMALDSYTDNFKAHKFFYKKNFVPRGFHFINVLDQSKIR